MSTTTQLFYVSFGGVTGDDTVSDATVTNGTVVSGTTVDGVGAIEPEVMRDIALTPQGGIYFISCDNGDIYKERAGQAVSFTSAVVTNPSGTGDSIESMSVDSADNILYFIDGPDLYAEHFTSGFASTQSLTNLGAVDNVDGGTASATGALVYDAADHTGYFAAAAGSVSFSFGVTTGSITSNYIYKVSNLTSSASSSSISITDALAGNKQVPLVDGTVEGMALDTANDTLYFTTNPTPNLGSTPDAGIFAVALSGPEEGILTTIYSLPITNYDSGFAHFGSISIDSSTGEYYIAAVAAPASTNELTIGEIYVGNVDNIGVAPTLLADTPGSDSTEVPLALAVDGGPSLTGTSIAGIDGNGGTTTGVLHTTDTVTIAVTMNGAVTVSGTPHLSLNDGGTASYISGSGSNVLLFTYTPGSEQNTATLGVTALTGTVTDALGVAFAGSVTASFPGVSVDNTPPGLAITGTSSDALQGGSSITALAGTPVITDPYGSGTLTSATIAISNAQSGDVLGINGATAGSLDAGAITYVFSGSALTLTGNASLAQYEAALAEVTYRDGGTDNTTSGNPVRVLDWHVDEGALISATEVTSITIERALTLSAGGTVTLTPGHAVVLDPGITLTDLDNDQVTSATISIGTGFTSGDELNFTNQNGISGSYNAATGILVLSGASSAANYRTALASVTMSSLNADPTNGNTDTQRTINYQLGDAAGLSAKVSSDVVAVCYRHGTSILTANGPAAVETLAIGDLLPARLGGLQRIKWIGRQSFAGRFIRNNRGMLPVRIAARALGGGLPMADLYISPGHSMLLGETLVLARNLVNGVTITQDESAEDVHYFQIELEAHDCVLAEGAWSETYADVAGLRTQFHNEAEFWALYPDYETPEHLALCRTRPQSGPALAEALAPVVARASAGLVPGALHGWIEHIGADGRIGGWAQDRGHPELPVRLEVLCGKEVLGTLLACDGREDLRAAGIGQGYCGFSFAAGRAFTPAEAARITIRRAGGGPALPLTHELGALALRARIAA